MTLRIVRKWLLLQTLKLSVWASERLAAEELQAYDRRQRPPAR